MAEEQLDLEKLEGELAEKAQELLGRAADYAKENPYAAVGIALGLGWVLGNGLHPRVVLGVARAGWKAALAGALAGGGGLLGILGAQGGAEEHGRESNGPTGGGARRATSEGTTRSRGGTHAKD